MIYLDVCDFNGNVTFKQDFDSCELLSFGHDSHFQKMLLDCCKVIVEMKRSVITILLWKNYDKNCVLS